MNELIKISTDQNGNQTISAKDLYEFLGLDVGQYSRWYQKNILRNQYAREGEDWVVFDMNVENPLGGRPTKDFALTLDFAKRLAMMARSVEGERIRNYFLECERKAKQETSLLEIEKLKLVVATFDARLKLLERRSGSKKLSVPRTENKSLELELVKKHFAKGDTLISATEATYYLEQKEHVSLGVKRVALAIMQLTNQDSTIKRDGRHFKRGYWLTTIS